MVNVTHNADNRRSGNHVLLILFFLSDSSSMTSTFSSFSQSNVKLHRDLFCLLVIHFLIDGDNLAL